MMNLYRDELECDDTPGESFGSGRVSLAAIEKLDEPSLCGCRLIQTAGLYV